MADSDHKEASDLIDAAQIGDVAAVKAFLARGAPIDSTKDSGATALWVAAEHGRTHIVKLLAERGAAINVATKDGSTPLYVACQNGFPSVVRALLGLGADVDAAKNTGASPVLIAAQQGYMGILEQLAKAGANLDHVMRNGLTPFVMACYVGQAEVAGFLLARGVDIHKEGAGKTGMAWAQHQQHIHVVSTLISIQLHMRRTYDAWIRYRALVKDGTLQRAFTVEYLPACTDSFAATPPPPPPHCDTLSALPPPPDDDVTVDELLAGDGTDDLPPPPGGASTPPPSQPPTKTKSLTPEQNPGTEGTAEKNRPSFADVTLEDIETIEEVESEGEDSEDEAGGKKKRERGKTRATKLIHLEGYMKKRGGAFAANFQERYFVLQNHELTWYKGRTGKALGRMPLKGVKFTDAPKHNFTLYDPHSNKTYELKCGDTAEKARWTTALQDAIAAAQNSDHRTDIHAELAEEQDTGEEPATEQALLISQARGMPGNTQCADCDFTGVLPFADVIQGIFLCRRCAQIHASELPAYASYVQRCVPAESWDICDALYVREMGNVEVNAVLEYSVPAEFPKPLWNSPLAVAKKYITEKYNNSFRKTNNKTQTAPVYSTEIDKDIKPGGALAARRGTSTGTALAQAVAESAVGTLVVNLVGAQHLVTANCAGTSCNAVCQLVSGPFKVASRRYNKSLSPQWNQMLCLPWDGYSDLEVYVFHRQDALTSKLIGTSRINPKELDCGTDTISNLVIELKAAKKLPGGVVEGFNMGLKGLGKGLFQGVTGVVMDPVKGAKNDGLLGFAKGVGTGVGGLVWRPLKGGGQLVSKTAQGITGTGKREKSPTFAGPPPSNFKEEVTKTLGNKCTSFSEISKLKKQAASQAARDADFRGYVQMEISYVQFTNTQDSLGPASDPAVTL
eukprot:TRINITY_DN61627_c0_g1_i1.p1 TRINITY_DN61627_c0_g1~~TRINITY_DN61627_c0_g1_i1.p1  ORF type:complete len:906 (-),score=94.69 TRINITY_DN61627_c0_g1_i1:55-2772(-)